MAYIPEVPGTPDFTPIATQLRDIGAPWTFLILTNADTGQLLQAMQRIGYKPRTAAWPGMDDPDYLKAFAPVSQGMGLPGHGSPRAWVSQGMIVAEETAPLDSADPAVRTFVADFTKQAGHAPNKFEELGWSQAELMVKTLQDSKALTRSCLMGASHRGGRRPARRHRRARVAGAHRATRHGAGTLAPQ